MSKEEQLHLPARVKAERRQKLHELGCMIKGTSYAGSERTKGASVVNDNNPKPKITLRYHPILNERQKKLKELARLIRSLGLRNNSKW